MDTNNKLVIPTVHINGTGGIDLIEQYSDAMLAIEISLQKLPSPHGRDYYLQDGYAVTKAILQRDAWATSLRQIYRDLEAIGMNVVDQNLSRQPRTTTAASAGPQVSEPENATVAA